MKLFIVLDHENNVKCVCRKEANAEARVPGIKRTKKIQNSDKSWSFGRTQPWSIRHVEVSGEQIPGVKTEFVYIDSLNQVSFNRGANRQEVRILDNNGLFVQEAE